MPYKYLIMALLICCLCVPSVAAVKNSDTEKEGNMKKIVQTAGRDALASFAPEFAHYNDDILFGENWNDPTLDPKTRSIITVVSLMSQGITDSSLEHHLQTAKKNGVTKKEIAGIITHNAFYAGWPKAWAVFRLAKNVWKDDEPTAAKMDKDSYQKTIVFDIGQPNDAYAKYFVGQSYLSPVSTEQVKVSNVTFEPGCRNNWHIHHAKSGGGQMLIGVGGQGYYQEWGKKPIPINEGDVIHIPANVKHWHGASPNSWFSHLAFSVPGEEVSNEWLEPVDAAEYNKLK